MTVIPPATRPVTYSTRTGDAPVLPDAVLSVQVEIAYLDARFGVGARFYVTYQHEGWSFSEHHAPQADAATLAHMIVDPNHYYIRYRLLDSEGWAIGETYWG